MVTTEYFQVSVIKQSMAEIKYWVKMKKIFVMFFLFMYFSFMRHYQTASYRNKCLLSFQIPNTPILFCEQL